MIATQNNVKCVCQTTPVSQVLSQLQWSELPQFPLQRRYPSSLKYLQNICYILVNYWYCNILASFEDCLFLCKSKFKYWLYISQDIWVFIESVGCYYWQKCLHKFVVFAILWNIDKTPEGRLSLVSLKINQLGHKMRFRKHLVRC